MARIATTNSGRLDDISATRSPARTPRCSSMVAMPLVSASSSGRRVLPVLEGEPAGAHVTLTRPSPDVTQLSYDEP